MCIFCHDLRRMIVRGTNDTVSCPVCTVPEPPPPVELVLMLHLANQVMLEHAMNGAAYEEYQEMLKRAERLNTL